MVVNIPSLDEQSFVLLRLEERAGEPVPSRRLAVETRLGSFAGGQQRAWVDDAVLDRFVADVEHLEQTRQGAATLHGMSTGAILLGIEVVDSAGHVVVTVRLGREEHVAGEHRRFGVEGSFEIDPTALPMIIRELSALART